MKHVITVGLGFGDEGKGATVDHLARTFGYKHVVRYNGGPQAAHHVVDPSTGHVHCFSQLGAASMLPGVQTHLSRWTLIEPMALHREASLLEAAGYADALERVHIARGCVIITPYHRAMNRLKEQHRDSSRHGSCGLGVGQAWLDARFERAPVIRAAEIDDRERLIHKLEQLRLFKLDQAEQSGSPSRDALAVLTDRTLSARLADRYIDILRSGGVTLEDDEDLYALLRTRPVIFEGAQGALLDADRGLFPHVTATNTTAENALALLAQSETTIEHFVLGISRAYTTRHGAGPMPTESAAMTSKLPELHNATNPWQGAWRSGDFDEVLARYAMDLVPQVDAIALTNLDRLTGLERIRTATSYIDESGLESEQITTRSSPRPHELSARAAWSARIARCQPITIEHEGWQRASTRAPLPPNARGYVEHLERVFARPIVSIGLGATSADRQDRGLVRALGEEKEKEHADQRAPRRSTRPSAQRASVTMPSFTA